MIHAVLIFNNSGKPRLTKFYSPSSPQTRASILSRIFNLVSPRDDTLCNFVDIPKNFGFFPNSTTSTSNGNSDTLDRLGGGGGESHGDVEVGHEEDDEELRVIYRHYATLYFTFVVDQSESELGILDLIQVFVESLDRCFENVCELDLIFHFDEVHTLLNCIITGGLVLDTSLDSIQQSFKLQTSAKKHSSSQTNGLTSGFSAITSGLGGGGGGGGNSMVGGNMGGISGGTGSLEGAWGRITSGLGGFGVGSRR